jgi:hypothetical protein
MIERLLVLRAQMLRAPPSRRRARVVASPGPLDGDAGVVAGHRGACEVVTNARPLSLQPAVTASVHDRGSGRGHC